MSGVQSDEKDNKLVDSLNRLTKRIEEATVDIHEMKRDLKFVKLRLHGVETNTEITKIDIEKVRNEVGKVSQSTDDLIGLSKEILSNMVTRDEFENFSHRVTSLERTAKAF